MASVDGGASILAGVSLSKGVTPPAGAGVSPSSANAFSAGLLSSKNLETGDYGPTSRAQSNGAISGLAGVVIPPGPYLQDIEPDPADIRKLTPILFNLVDPSQAILTRDISGVTIMILQGMAWETVMFRGVFQAPYLQSIAIQMPISTTSGPQSALAFQIRRTGGWGSNPQLRVQAWDVEAT